MMRRASIGLPYEVKQRFLRLKWKFEEETGQDLTETQFFELLLDCFTKNRNINMIETIEDYITKLEKLITSLGKIQSVASMGLEEFEKLKEENKHLKEEVERLKSELEECRMKSKEALKNLTPRSLYWAFIERTKEEREKRKIFDKDAQELMAFLANIGALIHGGEDVPIKSKVSSLKYMLDKY